MVKIKPSEELIQLNNKIKDDIRSLQQFTRKRNVLLLEDDDVDTDIFKNVINSYNSEISIDRARDGKEGLEIIKNKPRNYTHLFVDLKMPIMNGFEFLKAFNQISFDQKIEVIVISSINNSKDLEYLKKINQEITFLQKPINIDKLFKIFSG
ncbi:MAG: response regulator [Cyclobacteriaceae bacterium]